MKCEFCNKDRDHGSNYYFYFGKHVGTQIPAHKMRKYSFVIAGQKTVWICYSCVLKRFLISGIGWGAILFLFSVFVVLFEPKFIQNLLNTDPKFIGVMGLIIFGFILVRHVMINGMESLSLFGDELAIRANRAQLQAAGNNAFFTRAQYNQLNSS